jgi:SAM-dependent MidA family methyltransferase
MIERLDHFMARANSAYYATHNPFADFTTSPEISQVFGELIGLWTLLVWRAMEAPANVLLVEAGPGRGTMMIDALRAIRQVAADFVESTAVHFIETSPRLIETIKSAMPEAHFHSDIDTIPDQPIIFLANEFFDALPIRQFIFKPDGWHERHVCGDRLVDFPSDVGLPNDSIGTIREISPAGEDFLERLVRKLMKVGGAGLIIDYGSIQGGPGESLQAIQAGKPVSPTLDPGSADLTAHVDFKRLAAVACAAGAKVWGPTTQGRFLSELGIHERTSQLGRHVTPDQAYKLIAATRRITAHEAMGSLFKVMAISASSLLQLPGFTI